MKNNISALSLHILHCVGTMHAQTVEFIGKKIQVPKDCEKVSQYEIDCGGFSLSWAYMSKGTGDNVIFDQIGRLKQRPGMQYKPMRILVDSVETNGFVASFSADNVKYFMLMTSGEVRGKHFLLQAIDVQPFWRYEGYNAVFDSLVKVLPENEGPGKGKEPEGVKNKE